MAITGINTAPIKKDNRLHVMTFKFRDENRQDRIIYMPLTTLVDFLMVLRSRTLKIAARIAQNDATYKAKTIAQAEALSQNIPAIFEQDVMQPDAGNLVMAFAPKFQEERFSLVMSMQNEQIVMIEIEDLQVEFIILAIRQAIEAIHDHETINIIASLLDFIQLCFVDLASPDSEDYREISHEGWKQALFTHHVAVLYCFDTEQGQQILAGTMMKCSEEEGSEGLDSIVKRVALMTPGLQALQQKHRLCQTFARKVPTQPGQMVTKEFCHKTLRDYRAEAQASLNA